MNTNSGLKVIACLTAFTGIMLIAIVIGFCYWGAEGLAKHLYLVYSLSFLLAALFTYFAKTKGANNKPKNSTDVSK